MSSSPRARRGASRPEPRPSRVPVLLGMVLVGVLSIGLGLGWYALRGAAEPEPASGPNVVVIVLDDLDVWTWEHAPQLRERLAGGREYTNAFVTNSLCCPSRVSMLTGLYPHNHGVLSNAPPIGGFARAVRNGAEERTVSAALHEGGYRTGLVGKYLNGYGGPEVHAEAEVALSYVPPGWDTWYAAQGSTAYEGVTINANGVLSQPDGYLTDLEADAAVAFMTDAASQAPYFLWVAVAAPHLPAVPAGQDAKAEIDGELPPGEEDVSDKPGPLRRLEEHRTPKQLEDVQRRRLRSLLSVERLIARVMDAMDDDTYLVVTSDNGFHIGQHGLPLGKATAYEEDIRVPLVVIGPEIEPGTDERLVLNIDLAPTIAELAGVELPGEADGVSLLATPAVERDAFVIEHEATDTIPVYSALRTADGRLYVKWASGGRELYHLDEDPGELENLAFGPLAERNYGEEMELLSRRLAELVTCAAESCR